MAYGEAVGERLADVLCFEFNPWALRLKSWS